MSSLRKTVFGLVVGPTVWNCTDAEERHFNKKVDKILATLQTAVLAAAPEKYNGQFKSSYTLGEMADPANNTHGLAYENGYNKALTDFTKALQQLFESEES